jgi:3-deoxy-D-manno-octulosonate 8-phosphate phosphatase (KDO 8-P phosphatase)
METDKNKTCTSWWCGFKACPSDAAREIREICDYVSPYPGGHGAVRDIIEYILKGMGKWDELLRWYGKETRE